MGNWIQPVLTSNGTMGGDSFACNQSGPVHYDTFYGWLAFNPEQIGWASTSLPAWIEWYNPIAIKISSISVLNGPVDAHFNAYSVQGRNSDIDDWETIISGTGTTGNNVTWTMPVDSLVAYKYHRIYITSCTGSNGTKGYCSVGQLNISATYKAVRESNSSDYDYTTIVDGTPSDYDYTERLEGTPSDYDEFDWEIIKYSPIILVKEYYKFKYWKYEDVYSSWTQPFMTEANGQDGDISKMRAWATGEYNTSTPAWKALDGDANTYWRSPIYHPHGFFIATPIPIRIQQLIITNPPSGLSYLTTFTFRGSNDLNTWTTWIENGTRLDTTPLSSTTHDINATEDYSYFLIVLSASSGLADYAMLGDIKIKATYKSGVKSVEGTPDNYDYTTKVAGNSNDYDGYTYSAKKFSFVGR